MAINFQNSTEKVKTVIGCYFILSDFQSRGHLESTFIVWNFLVLSPKALYKLLILYSYLSLFLSINNSSLTYIHILKTIFVYQQQSFYYSSSRLSDSGAVVVETENLEYKIVNSLKAYKFISRRKLQ